MEVRLIDPGDDGALEEWHGVLHAVERDTWPDRAGFSLRDIRAFARHSGRYRRFDLLAAGEPGGPVIGVGMMEVPLRDNLHSAEITVAVHPGHRRRGAGTAIVQRMAAMGAADGRSTLNAIVDVPLAVAETHPGAAFARRVGLRGHAAGNQRHLMVPMPAARVEELRGVVESARTQPPTAASPSRRRGPRSSCPTTASCCGACRRTSRRATATRRRRYGTRQRIREYDQLLEERGVWKLAAVARHVDSGHLVAFSELLLSPDAPTEAWQLATLVHPEHRGHRLGLAVKLANVEALARCGALVRRIVTGNAAVNRR